MLNFRNLALKLRNPCISFIQFFHQQIIIVLSLLLFSYKLCIIVLEVTKLELEVLNFYI